MSTGEIPFDEVQTWHVDALKEYCRKRNLKVSGKKAELVARVFAASEMGIPVCLTAVERVLKTEDEKAKLLQTPEGSLPDPLSLKDGWFGESNSMQSWPPIFLSDITVFLMSDHPGKDVHLHERILNEYKEGKAYRLYESGWLKEVFMHGIAKESKYCFLKARCTHSMKISDVPHTVWICCDKTTGRIISGYCTCVAGISSSCIHVTALLFRIEAANRSGLTNPACTSKPCRWDVPAGKTEIEPMQICDMDWKASKLNKEPSRPLTDAKRSLFNPVVEKCPQNAKEKRHLLYLGLKDILPDACFMAFGETAFSQLPVHVNTNEHVTTNNEAVPVPLDGHEEVLVPLDDHEAVPATDSRFSNENAILELAKTVSSADEFLSLLVPISNEEVDYIETVTIGQADNEIWCSQHKGRITASNFYRVFTKVNTINSSEEGSVGVGNLIGSLLGSKAPPENLHALKYGRNMEPLANEKYLKYFKKQHSNTRNRECGLFINRDKTYLGATPDLLVGCSCCGNGVLEIKCPYSIVNELPTPENLSYLTYNNGKIALKQKHKYYAQIQGQMAISNRNWCHFFIFTQKGQYMENIAFDTTYWKKLEDNLTQFYVNYMAPELVRLYS